MVQYTYRGFVLELSLVEVKKDYYPHNVIYFRIEGKVPSHPKVSFSSDASNDHINSVQKKFEKWVDEMLQEYKEEKHLLSYKGIKLKVSRDVEGGLFKGKLESYFDGKYEGGKEFEAQTLVEIKDLFEEHVWNLYTSYLKFQELSSIDIR